MKYKHNFMPKKIAMVLAVILFVFPIASNSAQAVESKLIISGKTQMRLDRMQTIIELKIEEMEEKNQILYPDEAELNLTISEVKPMHDFAGNDYTLYELEPSGYIVFHENSATFVEFSATASSPYLGLYDELLYAGPNEYYNKELSQDDNDYHHTIMDKTISEYDSLAFSVASENMNKKLMDAENTNINSYLNGETSTVNMAIAQSSNLSQAHSGNMSTQSVTVGDLTLVNNYTFFTRLVDCGNNVNGTCGYIAAGMLLSYQQATHGGNFVSSSNLTWACSGGVWRPSINDALHTDLVSIGASLGYGNGTISGDIRQVVKEYLRRRGVTVTHHDGIFIGNPGICDFIKDNRPVIWFGEVINNTHNSMTWFAHAFVVYGFDWSLFGGYSYVAHFGWAGANAVSFTGVLGTAYTFTV